MQRGRDKYGPRLDEEMRREVSSLTSGAPGEARTRSDRIKEAPSEEVAGAESGGARPLRPRGAPP